jgi:carboxylesterase type B
MSRMGKPIWRGFPLSVFRALMLFLLQLLTIVTTFSIAQQQSPPFYPYDDGPESSGWTSSSSSSAGGSSSSSIRISITLSGLGIVQGIRSHGLDFFGGIPYAAPPVGNLRWEAPQEVDAWRPHALDASDYGPDCYQVVDPLLNPLADPSRMSEDCLYLNVFAPAGASSSAAAAAAAAPTPDAGDQKLFPVMVWFHGGAFQQGGSNRPEYNARRLAQEERVVVVTVNYRLGSLGFLVSSELGIFGNFGLMDQRAALYFVKRHIASFGGNPNSITLFGESAGAVMIGLHLQMENGGPPGSTDVGRNSRLFHRAILQSNPMGYQFRSVVVADFLGDALRRAVDCRDLGCMKSEAVQEIIRAQSSLMGIPRSVGDFFAWGPTLTTRSASSTMGAASSATAFTTSSSSLFFPRDEWEGRSMYSADDFDGRSNSIRFQRKSIRRSSSSAKFAVNVTQPLLNLDKVPDDIPIIIGTNQHEGEMFVHGAFPLTMSKAVYWMFVGALFKDSATKVLKHYRPYVEQIEGEAQELARKQLQEEENKQYYTEHQQELEAVYQSYLLKTSRGGGDGTSDSDNPEHYLYGNQVQDLIEVHDNGAQDESATRNTSSTTPWWQNRLQSVQEWTNRTAIKLFAPPNQELLRERKRQRLELLKQKAKERALKEAAKVVVDYRPVMSRIITDYLFRCPSWHYAHLLSLQRVSRIKKTKRRWGRKLFSNNVYVYRFSQPTHVPGFRECWGKSCHMSELPFVFKAMDIIRSNYSTLSPIAQEEAPVPPEYPYTDLLSAYRGWMDDDQHQEPTKRDFNGGVEPETQKGESPTARQSRLGPSSRFSYNYTSYFQRILDHFFGDYFLEDSDEEIASDMAQRWVAFARTGNPNYEESKVEWIPWRFVPSSQALEEIRDAGRRDLGTEEESSFEDYLPWDRERELYNIWKDIEEDREEADATGGTFNEDEEHDALVLGKAYRQRALDLMSMEVVEDDPLRTELKRTKRSTMSSENPLAALGFWSRRWNSVPPQSNPAGDEGGGKHSERMIHQIQRMAQDMGVLGRGLSGDYERLLGVGLSLALGGGGPRDRDHGYWDDDFFPQLLELRWPPEGRLIERDCTCDFWERIRCKCNGDSSCSPRCCPLRLDEHYSISTHVADGW